MALLLCSLISYNEFLYTSLVQCFLILNFLQPFPLQTNSLFFFEIINDNNNNNNNIIIFSLYHVKKKKKNTLQYWVLLRAGPNAFWWVLLVAGANTDGSWRMAHRCFKSIGFCYGQDPHWPEGQPTITVISHIGGWRLEGRSYMSMLTLTSKTRYEIMCGC